MKYLEIPFGQLLDNIASKEPVPGGGTVSALAGAKASALVAMVANLTIGKKKYREVEERMKENLEKVLNLKDKFIKLAKEDEEAFNKVMEAFSLPKKTEEEKQNRRKAIEDASIIAAKVPLETMKTAFEGIKYSLFVLKNGNKNAVTDSLVSALLYNASVNGAYYNVRINIDGMDREEAKKIRKEADEILVEFNKVYQEILNEKEQIFG